MCEAEWPSVDTDSPHRALSISPRPGAELGDTRCQGNTAVGIMNELDPKLKHDLPVDPADLRLAYKFCKMAAEGEGGLELPEHKALYGRLLELVPGASAPYEDFGSCEALVEARRWYVQLFCCYNCEVPTNYESPPRPT